MDISERVSYLRPAFRDAGIAAPDEFLAKLAEKMDDSMEKIYSDWEPGPQDVKDWLDGGHKTFREYMDEKELEDPAYVDEHADNMQFAIEAAMEGGAFGEWDEIRGKCAARAGEIAASLASSLPFPDIEYSGMKNKFRCNILLGTPDDRNTEFGTSDNFAQWFLEDKPLEFYRDTELGALSWLVQSQGKSLSDIGDGKGRFAKSLLRELSECGGYYGAPTFCVSLDIADLEHLKAGGSFRIYDDAALGIVEMYNGAGGVFAIELERPVVIDQSVIYELQVEGAKNRNYTVESIYGFSGKAWEADVGLVDEPAAKPMTFAEFEKHGEKTPEKPKAGVKP